MTILPRGSDGSRLRTRFAPSPTGPLHLGHAYSVWIASNLATFHGGELLLRIEDIDQSRARPEWENLIRTDLEWLGVRWSGPVLRQSERMEHYRAALQRLWDMGLLYPCSCTRADIASAVSAPQEGVRLGPDGVVYPGTCRAARRAGPLPDSALRLNMRKAMQAIGAVEFLERNSPTRSVTRSADNLISSVGDVVLARRGVGTSYHLSVVLDDAGQGITHVVRGEDLFEATAIHVVLQRLLELPTPVYLHHDLIRDADGRRLAKRHDARAIREYRDRGATPADLRRLVGLRQAPRAMISASSPPRTAV
ncbi:tRNA glutamyl-Q(34) synthetase GluQRS [Roseitranquillus sediminis]|uniref:tRNA glutamyl-Q(34) synthetase GluQRS n=1 Tax=Roseitranquillus sediminis TaxID=2809051 RepID=UPI003872C757